MPRAEVGTPKYIANKMKSKGLQRLRWYCQVCEKQCRDENGFKMHVASESHLRQMLVVGEHAGKHIADFSATFQSEFVSMLSRRWGTKRVKANNVYQEYIAEKSHLHMNATRWVTLTEFIKHLGRAGIAHVDDTEKGWFIAWIDNSPKALARQEASMKKERSTMNDEQRERLLIADQIERAQKESEDKGEGPSTSGEVPPPEEGLKRDEGEKVKLSFAAKPMAPAPLKLNPLKPAGNPLKRPNVFKQAAAAASSSQPSTTAKRKDAPVTAAERLMQEEQERKRRRMERDGGATR